MSVRLDFYLCPTPGCGQYYGASNMPDLSVVMNADLKAQPTYPAIMCPNCRAKGLMVERVLRAVIVPLELGET